MIESNQKRVVFNRLDLTEIDFSTPVNYKRMGFVQVKDNSNDTYQTVKNIDIYSDSEYYSTSDGNHHICYYDSDGKKGLITVSKNPFKYFCKENRLYRALLKLKTN